MLTLNQLKYRYYQEWFQFDTSVQRGDIVAIMGPSGAGKSTLLSLVAGFISPAAGQIVFNGQSLNAVPAYQRPFSMLFQEHNLFVHLSVKQNIGLGMNPGLNLSTLDWQVVKQAAEQVGIGELLDRLPSQLSGGQRQRVALARCFVQNRPIWLLDEPFSALDPQLRTEMLALVKRLAEDNQFTVLMVTHNFSDAKTIANRFLFIDHHRITEQGTIEELDSPAYYPSMRRFIHT